MQEPADLAASAKKVQDAAAALGLQVAVREMPQSTRTAEEAAAACGVQVGQIVKSLIFLGADTKKPYLLLVSGKNRVSETAVAVHLGEKLTRPAANFVRDVTGFAIGGIPPFGHDRKLPTWLDADLLGYDIVWAAAGTPRAVFAVNPARLRNAIGATVIGMQ
jgi:prolyl-tRNA editing enzyme YbaK/EbsC (Cys-tRNA(Pro) deacylase)